MADIYSPWMAGAEKDVTDEGFVTPEYMDMMQGESEDEGSSTSEAEPGEEMPGQPEEDSGEDPMKSALQMALQTINQQFSVIQTLMAQLKGA